MKIEIDKHELEFVLDSWEGHIKNNTCCGDCKIKSVKCPVNNFFKKLNKKIKITEKDGIIRGDKNLHPNDVLDIIVNHPIFQEDLRIIGNVSRIKDKKFNKY